MDTTTPRSRYDLPLTTLDHPTTCSRCHEVLPAGTVLEQGPTAHAGSVWERTVYYHADHDVCHACTRQREQAAEAARLAREAERERAEAARAELATERQVQYARDLARRNPGVAGGITTEQLRRLSRREISQLIDQLRESL